MGALEDVCRREFLEETGYHVTVEKLVDARIENLSGETRVNAVSCDKCGWKNEQM